MLLPSSPESPTGGLGATKSAGSSGLEIRAAVVHDWFQGYHGAERAAHALSDLFAADFSPDIYTFAADRSRIPQALAELIIRESALSRLPGLRPDRGGRWRALLPYMPRYFRSLDLGSYDLVLVSSHSCAIHTRAKGGAPMVLYSHTPARYIWTPDIDQRGRAAVRLALRAYAPHLRRIDREAASRPDLIVANSTAVRERIRRHYGRDAFVVHPPVDVDEFSAEREKEPGLFLWVQRLVPYKAPERVVAAFEGLPYRLVMVGDGPLGARLRRKLPPNVTLLPHLARGELVGLFARASGFVHVAEEDFGIAMVEALASGVPVLALARGGAVDIVRPNRDGVLISHDDVAEIRRGARAVAERGWDTKALRERSTKFSRERFRDEMAEVVTAALPAR